jgi:hypothetical protein
MKRNLITTSIIALLGIVMFSSCGDVETKPVLTQAEKDSLKQVTITNKIEAFEEKIKHQKEFTWEAKALINLYSTNEIKADNHLKDKYTYVRGKIGDIGKDILGTPYITIGKQDYILSVQCMFDDKFMNKLAKLNKGQKVVVYGKCTGSLMNVMFEDCSLVDDIPVLQKKLKKFKKKYSK